MSAIISSTDTAALADVYRAVRARTVSLCEPLEPADYIVQSMPDVSPTRWHLAHVSWFFETFILKNTDEHFQPFNRRFEYLFNSYYNSVGEQFPRSKRGQMTRPSTDEVFEYRQWVDERVVDLLHRDALSEKLKQLLVLGIQHEQQHQELMLMDIKHVLFQNPLFPAYRPATMSARVESGHGGWSTFDEGLFEFGHGGQGFAYDNESPRHRAFVDAYALSNQLVTNGDYLNFMTEGGYRTPTLWLSDGWDWIKREQVSSPLYWVKQDGTWFEFTLGGLVHLDLARPVSHISHYEADAYATWADARLPTEYEWELAASSRPLTGHFADAGEFHPRGSTRDQPLQQLYGDVWEWTRSAYQPYPGFKAAPGAVGEYNGKFMCNQMVMRGGCCVTPADHIRPTYRNFFYPHMRWQFGGIRLAKDARATIKTR